MLAIDIDGFESVLCTGDVSFMQYVRYSNNPLFSLIFIVVLQFFFILLSTDIFVEY